MKRILTFLSAVVVSSTISSQAILTVNPAGTGNFTTIDDAYQAAAPGDVILVDAGVYWGLTLTTKGVSVIASVEGTVFLRNRLRVLQTQDPVFVSGIRLETAGATEVDGIVNAIIDSPAAPVWIEGLSPKSTPMSDTMIRFTVGHDESIASWPPAMVTLSGCSSVDVTPPPMPWPPYQSPSSGLIQDGGRLTCFGCSFEGQKGRSFQLVAPFTSVSSQAGAPAIEQLGAATLSTPVELFLIGCDLQGGAGGFGGYEQDFSGMFSVCRSESSGGAGLASSSLAPNTTVVIQDSDLQGGTAGHPHAACNPVGALPGAPVDGIVATLLDGPYRSLTSSVGALPGEYELTFDATEAGALCLWTFGASAAPTFLPAFDGLLYPAMFAPLLVAGTTPGTGQLSISLNAGSAAGTGQTYYLQSAFLAPDPLSGATRPWLGAPEAVVLTN